jgi:polysaccharide pyruvyl transferase WcaK-like protein
MPNKRRERFFLYGYYGQGNLGDDLLLRATIEGIRRICPNASFVIRNEGHVAGLDAFDCSIETTGIDRILADQSRTKFQRLVETLAAYRRCLRGCDWFVFGGGTLFHERRSIAPLMLLVAICVLARVEGLRIVALGVGVAQLKSRAGRLALRIIVFMCELFAVRDAAAVAECAKAGVAARVQLTGDLAFTLASELAGHGCRKAACSFGRRLGLSVYPPALQDGPAGGAAFQALTSALTMMLARGWQVTLLAFHENPEQTGGGQFDRDLLTKLAAGVPPEHQELISQHTFSTDVTQIRSLFSDIDLHCGMRYHGHVLAVIFELPFVGISADNKIDAICGRFGMPVFAVDRLAGDVLLEAIESSRSRVVDVALREGCIAAAQKNFSELSQLMVRRNASRL